MPLQMSNPKNYSYQPDVLEFFTFLFACKSGNQCRSAVGPVGIVAR